MTTRDFTYTYSNETFSGCDMVATILMPNTATGQKEPYVIGELQTISYSIHQDRQPVRSIGNINVKDYVMGPRTIAGSLVFAVFNKHFAKKIMNDINTHISPGYSFMIDELPPFDIVLSIANEYGMRSKIVIYGVRLINEGQVMSINDIYTENTYQFVATDLEYLNNENSYTSSDSSGRRIYKIEKDPNTVINSGIKVPYVKAPYQDLVTKELRYKVKSNANADKLGIVDLWLVPSTKDGTITITSDTYSTEFTVASRTETSNIISLHLPVGIYEARWTHLKLKSSVKFAILEEIAKPADTIPAPLIEFVNDTRIIVKSNYKKHTHLSYTDSDNNTFKIKMEGGKGYINNLTPAMTYVIVTCNEAKTSESATVKVTTLTKGYDLYQDFLNYLSYNKKTLNYSDMTKYTAIVSEARDLFFSNVSYDNISNTFIDVKLKYQEKLKNLKQEDFSGLLQYQQEVDRLTLLINISEELLTISSTVETDKIYGFNYSTMVVKPPVVTQANRGNAALLVDKSIDSINFFKQYSKTIHFSTNINKRNFEELEDNMLCIYKGKPGQKHIAYAINQHGFSSPKVEFYTLSDNAQSAHNDFIQEQEQNIDYQLKKVDLAYGHLIGSSLSNEEKDKMLIEKAKDNVLSVVEPPIITETGNDLIKVSIAINENLIADSGLIVAICPIRDALKRVLKYKTEIKKEVMFTSKEHGIKPNTAYAIWIENNEEEQVSKTIIATSKINNITDENNITNTNNLAITLIVNKLIDAFKEAGLYSNIIKNIIDYNIDNSENNKVNILDNILKDIVEEQDKLQNLSKVLYVFFTVYCTEKYHVTENFFIEEPVFNKDDNTFTLKEACIMNKIRITKTSANYSMSKLNAKDTVAINQNSLYTILLFGDLKFTKRSGFILIDNNQNISTFKMAIKEGDV